MSGAERKAWMASRMQSGQMLVAENYGSMYRGTTETAVLSGRVPIDVRLKETGRIGGRDGISGVLAPSLPIFSYPRSRIARKDGAVSVLPESLHIPGTELEFMLG